MNYSWMEIPRYFLRAQAIFHYPDWSHYTNIINPILDTIFFVYFGPSVLKAQGTSSWILKRVDLMALVKD